MASVQLSRGIMKYFECTKCGLSYIYGGSKIPFTCGAFVGMVMNKGDMVAAGCGGDINEITKEKADAKVEQLRS